jgi:transcriptional regulator with XRE-family HTH domain/Tfp pilus assembly protein PilF
MERHGRGLPVNVERLKRLRKLKDWDTFELATRSGVAKRTLERWEGGGNAAPPHLISVAGALDVEVEMLIADDEPPATVPDGAHNVNQGRPTTGRGEKDPTAVHLDILEQNKSLAEELGVTRFVLGNFCKTLEEQHVPPEQLVVRLREMAASYKQFQERLQTLDSDNAASSRLFAEALAAAERGEYDYACTLLDEANHINSAEKKALEARLNKISLSQAATSAAKGDIYETQLRYAEAVACYRQAVEIVEQITEGNERELANYLSLLGLHLCHQGDFAGAKVYLERALAIREKVLGPEHPHTATSFDNLGCLLHNQCDFAGAKA